MGEIVVNERLDKERVHALVAPARKRPLVVRECPNTQWPGVASRTRLGPALHFPLPSSESEAVGNVIVGPTPQISLLAFAGEKNRLGLISPSPDALGIPAAGDGWLMMGMIVRVIRFQSLFKVIGITG